MTESAVVYTSQSTSEEAGADLAAQITAALPGAPPDALIVFASARYDYRALLTALEASCRPRVLVGASSAGEFTSSAAGVGSACALALRSSTMSFSVGLGRGLSQDPEAAAREVVASFSGLSARTYPHRSAFIMTDALAGYADTLIEHLTLLTSGMYQFFGGGAGDDARFSRTHVFYGTEPITDAVVALEILSRKPLGIGVGHGWTPASAGMRVTEAAGMRLISLDGLPAIEAFEEHARVTGQQLDLAAPLPFFLHNILGIETGTAHRLRVPLMVNPDGSVSCAAELPVGSVVYIMKADSGSAAEAAARATRSALAGLRGEPPKVALFFDCVATRLRMGDVFGFELQSVSDLLGQAQYMGCNTYGQIARAEGQFEGFHNCTAVVCVLPD